MSRGLWKAVEASIEKLGWEKQQEEEEKKDPKKKKKRDRITEGRNRRKN